MLFLFMMVFYRLLFVPGLLLALPYYLYRMWRRGGYKEGFWNRFGVLSDVPPKSKEIKRVWIQAVSVGELMAIGPLLEQLHKDPAVEVVLTTTTSTGLRILKENLAGLTIWHGVFPMDFWLFSRKAWKQIQPDLVILMEGELWPEHIHQASLRKTPVLLINARLSDRSYRRHLSFKNLTKSYYGGLDSILAGSETDQERFRQLGWIPDDRIFSTGNLKFDVELAPSPSPTRRTQMLNELGFSGIRRTVLLGSSTWTGEENALLHAFLELRGSYPELRLLIVPRHAERKSELVALMEEFPLKHHFRSDARQAPAGTDVYIADTTGELRMLTGFADLVFIGKSLPPNAGGQTPVEAASMGKPIVMGRNMSNFRDITSNLIRTGAAVSVSTDEELAGTLLKLLQSPDDRTKMGQRAADCIRRSRGATERIIDHIQRALD